MVITLRTLSTIVNPPSHSFNRLTGHAVVLQASTLAALSAVKVAI
jgi:hypothetical protein